MPNLFHAFGVQQIYLFRIELEFNNSERKRKWLKYKTWTYILRLGVNVNFT